MEIWWDTILLGGGEQESQEEHAFAWMCYCFFTTMGFFQEYHTFNFDILYMLVSVN